MIVPVTVYAQEDLPSDGTTLPVGDEPYAITPGWKTATCNSQAPETHRSTHGFKLKHGIPVKRTHNTYGPIQEIETGEHEIRVKPSSIRFALGLSMKIFRVTISWGRHVQFFQSTDPGFQFSHYEEGNLHGRIVQFPVYKSKLEWSGMVDGKYGLPEERFDDETSWCYIK